MRSVEEDSRGYSPLNSYCNCFQYAYFVFIFFISDVEKQCRLKMSEDVKLEVIKSTQEALSKYIKKPPLTEKLLRKPPFRYLHDITMAVSMKIKM